jgi:hypothetical protein
MGETVTLHELDSVLGLTIPWSKESVNLSILRTGLPMTKNAACGKGHIVQSVPDFVKHNSLDTTSQDTVSIYMNPICKCPVSRDMDGIHNGGEGN